MVLNPSWVKFTTVGTQRTLTSECAHERECMQVDGKPGGHFITRWLSRLSAIFESNGDRMSRIMGNVEFVFILRAVKST